MKDVESGCALLTGGSECRCAHELGLDEHELAQRAVDKFLWQQRARPDGRAAARRGLDAQLADARRRGTAALVEELLRLSVLLRLLGEDSADALEVDGLLAELGELADAGGDARTLGEVTTLRAHRAIAFGRSEDALVDAATALAVLTDVARPADADPVEWSRLLSRALNGLMMVLLKLGAHEVADEVSRRAVEVADACGTSMERLVHQLNRVRLQLSWALRLERGGRAAAAATRFLGAAQTARTAAELWGPAVGRIGAGTGAAVSECSIIGTAYALARPSPEHLDVLERLVEMAHFTEDRILLSIATARCLMSDERRAEAARALEPLRAELGGDHSEAVLAIALHREFALVHEVSRGVGRPSDALTRYAAALENELWDMREARLAALRSHAEHHRLAREHGAVAAQALQDPLTGLPNRRALDLRLAEISTAPAGPMCALALIDLDGFKAVNDAYSHAAGDSVLRTIASCLRTSLRTHDLVARYGGDEFVVVLPETPLAVARAALARATEGVAALPPDIGARVTVSVGVARLLPGDEPAAALAAADAAMYRAKRAGGNRVAGPEPAPPPPPPQRQAPANRARAGEPRHRGRGGLRAVPQAEPTTAVLPRVAAD